MQFYFMPFSKSRFSTSKSFSLTLIPDIQYSYYSSALSNFSKFLFIAAEIYENACLFF